MEAGKNGTVEACRTWLSGGGFLTVFSNEIESGSQRFKVLFLSDLKWCRLYIIEPFKKEV